MLVHKTIDIQNHVTINDFLFSLLSYKITQEQKKYLYNQLFSTQINSKGYSFARVINDQQIFIVVDNTMKIYDIIDKEIIRTAKLPFNYQKYPVAVIEDQILFVVEKFLYVFNLLTLNLASKSELPTPPQSPTDKFFQNESQLVFVNSENKKTYVINQRGEFFVGEILDNISQYGQFQLYKCKGTKIYNKKNEVVFEGRNTFDKSSYSIYKNLSLCLVDDEGFLKILIRKQEIPFKPIQDLEKVKCKKVEIKVEKFEDKELEDIKKEQKKTTASKKLIVNKKGAAKKPVAKKEDKDTKKKESKPEQKKPSKPSKPKAAKPSKPKKEQEKTETEYSYSYSEYSYSDEPTKQEQSEKAEVIEKQKSKTQSKSQSKQQSELQSQKSQKKIEVEETKVVIKKSTEEIELLCNQDQEFEPFENLPVPEVTEEQKLNLNITELQSPQEQQIKTIKFPATIGIQPIPQNDSWKEKLFRLKVILPSVEQLQDKKQFKFIRYCNDNKYDISNSKYIYYYYIQYLISEKLIDKQHVQPPISTISGDDNFKQYLLEQQIKSQGQDMLKDYINYLCENKLTQVRQILPHENLMKQNKDFVNYLNLKRSSSQSSSEIRQRYFYFLVENKYLQLNLEIDEDCQKQIERQQCLTELQDGVVLDQLEAFYILYSSNHIDISTIIPIPEHMSNNTEFVKYMRRNSVEKTLESYFNYLMEINYINIKNIMQKYNSSVRDTLQFYKQFLEKEEEQDSNYMFFKYLVEKDLLTVDMIVNKTLESSPLAQITELRDMHICYKHVFPTQADKAEEIINEHIRESQSLFPKIKFIRQNTDFNLYLRKKNINCLSFYETKILYLSFLIENDIIVTTDVIPTQMKMLQDKDFRAFLVDQSIVTNSIVYLQYLYLSFISKNPEFSYQQVLPFIEDLMQIDGFDKYLFSNRYLPGSNEQVFFLYILWCYLDHILNEDLLTDLLQGMLQDEGFIDYCQQNAISLQDLPFEEKLHALQQFYDICTEQQCDEIVTQSLEEVQKNEEFETFLIDYQTQLTEDTYKYWYVQFLRKQGKAPESLQDYAFMLRQRINYVKPKKRVCGKTFQDKVKFFSGL